MQLKQHIKRIHGERKPSEINKIIYNCNLCENTFANTMSLQRHMRNTHEQQKDYKCNLCQKAFGLKQTLQRHIER